MENDIVFENIRFNKQNNFRKGIILLIVMGTTTMENRFYKRLF